MSVIRVAWGRATGPTATASYDRALAAANVHNFNLVTVSSVIPDDAHIEVVGTAPDLGSVGDTLTVVQGRSTAEPGDRGAAGIGWARSESGRGIFYEADGPDTAAVRDKITRGLTAGKELRDWSWLSGETNHTIHDNSETARRRARAPGDGTESQNGSERASRHEHGPTEDMIVVDADPDPDEYVTAVVIAAYGESRPIMWQSSDF